MGPDVRCALALAAMAATLPSVGTAQGMDASSTPARAQAGAAHHAEHAGAAARRGVDSEWSGAIALYLMGGLSVAAGTLAAELTILGLTAGPSPPPCGSCDVALGIFVGGIVTGGLGVVAILVAIGLSVDAANRGGRLDRHASRVRLSPFGASVAIDF